MATTTTTIEERLATLEAEVARLKEHVEPGAPGGAKRKRVWRWFVGIFADDPTFDEVVDAGREWRNAERPNAERPNGEDRGETS